MDFYIFIAIIYGLPAIFSFQSGLEILLHLSGKRVSKNKYIIQKFESENGTKKLKRDFVISCLSFIIFTFLLIQAIVEG